MAQNSSRASRRSQSHTGLLGEDCTRPTETWTGEEPVVTVKNGQHRSKEGTPPIDAANFLSGYIFLWITPLIELGNKRPLQQGDLPPIGKRDKAGGLCQDLEREWQRQLRLKNPSLVWACFCLVGKSYLRNFSASYGLNIVCAFAQPVCIGQMISYFSGDVSRRDAYLYTLGYILLGVVRGFVYHFCYFTGSRQLGMQLRVALTSLIHKKVLGLSQLALLQVTTGHIVNLVSTDVQRLDEAASWLGTIPWGVVVFFAAFGLVWNELGASCLAGFGLVIPLVLLQFVSLKIISRYRDQIAKQTDKRIRLMNEIITGMQLIKMYTWEKPFHKVISAVRKLEFKLLVKRQLLLGANTVISEVGAHVISFICFATYSFTGNQLTPVKVFVTLTVLHIFKVYFLLLAIVAANLASESLVAIRRIQKFLTYAEANQVSASVPTSQPAIQWSSEILLSSRKYDNQEKGSGEVTSPCVIRVANASVSLQKVDSEGEVDEQDGEDRGEVFGLQDLSFTVDKGELLVVVGTIGSGKTSLLMLLLGELQARAGSCSVRGSMAYTAQLAWVFSGTIRENILFGRPLDVVRYNKGILACGLDKDLLTMSHGDRTLVGERGVKLSGGQKARIGLARALYQDADVYLLDDPLSAVDAEVGRQIFDRCVRGLLKEKTVVLVTHQLQFLPQADRILVLEHGRSTGLLTYQQLMEAGTDLSASLIPSEGGAEDVTGKADSQSAITQLSSDEEEQEEAEDRQLGSVIFSHYWKFLRAGASTPVLVFAIIYCIFTQACSNASDLWLAYWTTRYNETSPVLNCSNGDEGPFNCSILSTPLTYPKELFFGIWGGLLLFFVILVLIRSVILRMVFLSASKNLHEQMLSSILRVPMLFFNTNPSGRVLNRFAKDVNLLDVFMPFVFYEASVWSITLICSVVVISIVNPWTIIALLPLVVIYVYLRRRSLKVTREVKRLEAIARSPVFSQFSASLQGLTTIRAASASDQLQEKFHGHLDAHSHAWLSYIASTRWLGSRLELVSCVYLTLVAFSALLVVDYSSNLNVDAGTLGLSIAYQVALFGYLNWVVNSSAQVEDMMTSSERLFSYIGLEAEKEPALPISPAPDWPQHGAITGEGVTLRYSPDGPAVLKDLHFSIRSCEKVGIVGRTGAGKSSFINALFSLALTEGKLCVDGVQLDRLLLATRREKLSIIPQDPVLYSGTLRYNLDPFERSSDENVWNALELVQLQGYVSQLQGGLSCELSESGSNFSVGQRQLICLARALLNRNRILLIDEATANVDNQTDAVIQHTLRSHFTSCTVLTIAHRLNTVIDSDRIMVIDSGRIAEFATPTELLANRKGLFSAMVSSLGEEEARHLRDVATATH